MQCLAVPDCGARVVFGIGDGGPLEIIVSEVYVIHCFI
jgi:hypothetical protein